jgi:hypothetical protein
LIKLKKGSQNIDFEKVQQMIKNIKFQLEEARRIDEACKSQLEENKFLEAKIVAQKKKRREKIF